MKLQNDKTDCAQDAYLDIETSFDGNITVIGIYRDDQGIIQFVDEDITKENILKALENVETIYTFNGHSFDLPVIKKKLGLDIRAKYRSEDLRYTCVKYGFYGGLKRIEKELKLNRDIPGVGGNEAQELWQIYKKTNHKEVLDILLKYNQEDVVNLQKLRKRLSTILTALPKKRRNPRNAKNIKGNNRRLISPF